MGITADALLAADAGAFAALGGQDVGVAGVGVAPAQVGVQLAGLDGVVGVVGVGEGELPQRPEVGLDRVGPGGVGRGEAQLDLVLLRPAADRRALVGGEVVQDHVDRGAVGAGGPDRLQRGQGVGRALAAAVDAPQVVVADRVAAVEVADAVGAVVGRRQPRRAGPARAQHDPPVGRIPSGPNSSNAKHPVREVVQHVLDPVELGVAVGVGGLLPRLGALEGDAAAGAAGCRRASRPIRITPPWTLREVGGELAHATSG